MLGRRLLPPIAVGLMSLLSACAGTPKIDPDVDAYGMPNAELALQRSIDRVDAAMLNLGGLGGAGRVSATAGPVVAAELQRPLPSPGPARSTRASRHLPTASATAWSSPPRRTRCR